MIFRAACKVVLRGFGLALLCAHGLASAAPLTVTVTDMEGRPVPDVAVYLEPGSASRATAPADATAIMDQVDLKFEPHILVVQAGTSVAFPNSDSVAHHVYSFSRPNEFALPIYKGNIRAPVVFDDPGIVVLGCNIHDDMLGYILVVDTPWFSKTDNAGKAVLNASGQGAALLRIWSPRIRADAEVRSMAIAGDETGVVFHLSRPLRPNKQTQSGTLSWSDY